MQGVVTGALERHMLLHHAPKRVRYIGPLHYDGVDELSQRVFEQMSREFGVVTPITMHLGRPRLMSAVWGITRESLVAASGSRSLRERIATAVSQSNVCPFCVNVHSGMLEATGQSSVAPERGEVLQWAGATLDPDSPWVRSPPFSREEAPSFIGTAVGFHYVNRMVNVFLEESPLPLPSGLKWLKGAADRFASATLLKRMVHRSAQPGEHVLDPGPAELPAAFSWATSNQAIRDAFAIFASVMENETATSLDPRVREVVQQRVSDWQGESMPLDDEWLHHALAPLAAALHAEARLVLLTALASYRVTKEHVAALAEHRPRADVLDVTSYGAYLAAKQVSSWLCAR